MWFEWQSIHRFRYNVSQSNLSKFPVRVWLLIYLGETVTVIKNTHSVLPGASLLMKIFWSLLFYFQICSEVHLSIWTVALHSILQSLPLWKQKQNKKCTSFAPNLHAVIAEFTQWNCQIIMRDLWSSEVLSIIGFHSQLSFRTRNYYPWQAILYWSDCSIH